MNAVSTVYMYVNVCVCTMAMLKNQRQAMNANIKIKCHRSYVALLCTVCMVQDGCLEIDGTKMASGSV